MQSARKVVTSSSRSLSSVAVEGPRITLAKNALRFSAVARANNEAALDAAVKAQIKLDTANLPAEIASLDRYLNVAAGGATAKFSKDPAAWQNLALEDRFVREATRSEAWPFMAGGVAVLLLFSAGIAAVLPEEGKKNSKYISMIEGRHGVLGADHGHDDHAAAPAHH